MSARRRLQRYDHRLVRLVQNIQDPSIATRLGVPRSTASGWIRRAPRPVVVLNEDTASELRIRIAQLERRVRRLSAYLRVLLAFVRILPSPISRA